MDAGQVELQRFRTGTADCQRIITGGVILSESKICYIKGGCVAT